MAVRPDGREVASGERDGTVRLTDPATNRSTAAVAGGTGAVWSLAYSADGSRLASAGADGSVLIWVPRTPNAPPLTLRGHERDVFGVALHPRDAVAASVGRDGTLRRWELDRGGPGEVLLKVDAELRSVAFSPDGEVLASAGSDGVVRLVSSRTGKRLGDLVGHEGDVRTVSFSPDGRYLASAGRDPTPARSGCGRRSPTGRPERARPPAATSRPSSGTGWSRRAHPTDARARRNPRIDAATIA